MTVNFPGRKAIEIANEEIMSNAASNEAVLTRLIARGRKYSLSFSRSETLSEIWFTIYTAPIKRVNAAIP